jgi:hypothetical protein
LSVEEATLKAAISACVENLLGGVLGDLRVMLALPPRTLPDLTIIAPTRNLLFEVKASLVATAKNFWSVFET